MRKEVVVKIWACLMAKLLLLQEEEEALEEVIACYWLRKERR